MYQGAHARKKGLQDPELLHYLLASAFKQLEEPYIREATFAANSCLNHAADGACSQAGVQQTCRKATSYCYCYHPCNNTQGSKVSLSSTPREPQHWSKHLEQRTTCLTKHVSTGVYYRTYLRSMGRCGSV